MPDPYDYGDWVEDYHMCYGEYMCEASGGLCQFDKDHPDYWQRRQDAHTAGRFKRPLTYCKTCGQATGLAPKED